MLLVNRSITFCIYTILHVYIRVDQVDGDCVSRTVLCVTRINVKQGLFINEGCVPQCTSDANKAGVLCIM